MRLLRRRDDRLVFVDRTDEPYAILSHTWGKEQDEVTYKDICNGVQGKPGHAKINFCLDEAERQGFDHVWIDSCCIDRGNSSEVIKSINLMFKYYLNSAVCLVYLSDVGDTQGDQISQSRWFTRGWTLQELLAPSNLQFFSNTGRLIGTRASLAEQINATGVDVTNPLQEVPLLERFRWSLSRQTKEVEDLSYCLAGLLNVSLLAVYGVSEDSARDRLFDAIQEQHGRMTRRKMEHAFMKWQEQGHQEATTIGSELTPATLMESLKFSTMDSRRIDISQPYSTTCDWLWSHPDYIAWESASTPSHRLLWIKGNAGSGKSVLMKSTHSRCLKQDMPCVSFYFNARGAALDHSVQGMFSSLLYQLLDQSPGLQEVVVRELKHTYLRGKSWTIAQLQHGLLDVLKGRQEPLRCFIDALDECDQNDVQQMVDCFGSIVASGCNVHVCFASRHYPSIANRHAIDLQLEQQSAHRDAMRNFVHGHLDVACLTPERGAKLCACIIAKAKGIFLWAKLIILSLNLKLSRGHLPDIEAELRDLPSDLNELFTRIVKQSSERLDCFRLAMQLLLLFEEDINTGHYHEYMCVSMSLLGWEHGDSSCPYEVIKLEPVAMRRFVAETTRGLAHITEHNRVELIHESVRDFFLRHAGLQLLCDDPDAIAIDWHHEQLKELCIKMIQRRQDLPDHVRIVSGLQVYVHAQRAMRSISQDDFIRELHDNTTLWTADIRALDEPAFWYDILIEHDAALLLQRSYELYHATDGAERGDIDLRLAVRNDRPDILRMFLASGANPNSEDIYGTPLLMQWTFDDDDYYRDEAAETTRVLLEHGANSNARKRDGTTALVDTVKHDGHERCKLLLRHNADTEIRDHEGHTALYTAFERCSVGPAMLLIAKGAQLSVLEVHGQPWLGVLCTDMNVLIDIVQVEYSDYSIRQMQRTIQEPAFKHLKGWVDFIYYAYDRSDNVKYDVAFIYCLWFANLLLHHGQVLPMTIAEALNMLPTSTGAAIVLFTQGADPDWTNPDTGTPALHSSCRKEIGTKQYILDILLSAGAAVNATDSQGSTALMIAAEAGQWQHVKSLLHHKARVDLKNNHGQTALSLACRSRSERIVHRLLKKGAQIDLRNPNEMIDIYAFWANIKSNAVLKDKLLETMSASEHL